MKENKPDESIYLLKEGEFEPEGFEVSFGGGRIDRVDILEEDGKVYSEFRKETKGINVL